MDTIASILLYMNVLTFPGHYTQAQLNNYAAMYAPQISLIENTPGELPPILIEFEPEATIIVGDSVGG